MAEFSSTGFDVSSGDDDVVYEADGTVTTSDSATSAPSESLSSPSPLPSDLTARILKLKEEGGKKFLGGEYGEAVEKYDEGINIMFGVDKDGDDDDDECEDGTSNADDGGKDGAKEFIWSISSILSHHQEWNKEQRKAASAAGFNKSTDTTGEQADPPPTTPPARSTYALPKPLPNPDHFSQSLLSILVTNCSTCFLKLGRVTDAQVYARCATVVDPGYVKGWGRLGESIEGCLDLEGRNDDDGGFGFGVGGGEGTLDEAVQCYEKCVKLLEEKGGSRSKADNNLLRTQRNNYSRTKKLLDEQTEKMKEETIGKMKDLGNSFLSNFGLSLDNFQAKKDEKTGSYSISFNQGK